MTERMATLIIGGLLLMLAEDAHGLTAYNCTATGKTSRIDLLGPENCPVTEKAFGRPYHRRAQIVQSSVYRPIKMTQCRIQETAKITRCGYDSITYGTNTVAWLSPQAVDREICRKAGETGTLQYDGRTYTMEVNGPIYQARYYRHGSLTSEDRCITETFFAYNRQWESSYEEVTLSMEIATISGTYHEGSQTIKTDSGTVLDGTKGYAHTAHQGTLVWEFNDNECQRSFAQIYDGSVVIRDRLRTDQPARHPDDLENEVDLMEGALVLTVPDSEDKAMGFKLDKAARTCDRHCYGTQLEGVNLCFLNALDRPLDLPSLEYHPEVEYNNVGAQLAYLHLSTNQRVTDGFDRLARGLCELDRKVLRTKLDALAGGSPYMLANELGPGHQVVASGAAAIVYECANVSVTLRHTEGCYREVPVLAEGRAVFADPITLNLQDFGTPTVCSTLAPIMWRLNGIWHCHSPQVYVCPAPRQLKPTVSYLGAEDYSAGLSGGTHTAKDRAALNEKLRTNVATGPALGSSVAHSIGNAHLGTGNSLGVGVDLDQASDAISESLSFTYPLMKILTWIGAAILGPILGFFAIRSLYLCFARGQQVKEAQGCYSKFLAACCSHSAHAQYEIRRAARRQRRANKVAYRARKEEAMGTGHVTINVQPSSTTSSRSGTKDSADSGCLGEVDDRGTLA